MSEELSISVGGVTYSGWTSVSVRRAVISVTGDFEITMTDAPQGGKFHLAVGKIGVIKIGATPIMTGYIDAVDVTVLKNQHTVKIKGRDKTADLVDCSAMSRKVNTTAVSVEVETGIPTNGEFNNITVPQLFNAVCKPFGITVIDESGDNTPIPSLIVGDGETVFDLLDRACKLNGLIMLTDPLGRLVITRGAAGGRAGALVLGENVLEATGGYNSAGRYSYYRVVQHTAFGDEDADSPLPLVATQQAEFFDNGITRFRPLLIHADGGRGSISAEQRAKTEGLSRAAKGAQFDLVVPGWKTSAGLWEPNQITAVNLPALYLKSDMLVAEVSYTQDSSNAKKTHIKLIRPDAFDNRVLNKVVKPHSGIGVLLNTLDAGPETTPFISPAAVNPDETAGTQ